MAMKIDLHVEMEDGKTYDVVADQRDLAAWEAHSDGKLWISFQHLAMRFLACNALNRQKVLHQSWETFNDKCLEVSAPDSAEDKSN